MLVQLPLFGAAATEWLHMIIGDCDKAYPEQHSPPDLPSQLIAREEHRRLVLRRLVEPHVGRSASRALERRVQHERAVAGPDRRALLLRERGALGADAALDAEHAALRRDLAERDRTIGGRRRHRRYRAARALGASSGSSGMGHCTTRQAARPAPKGGGAARPAGVKRPGAWSPHRAGG